MLYIVACSYFSFIYFLYFLWLSPTDQPASTEQVLQRQEAEGVSLLPFRDVLLLYLIENQSHQNNLGLSIFYVLSTVLTINSIPKNLI